MNRKNLFFTFIVCQFLTQAYSQTTSDTVINKVKYNWVQYDLNKTPYEIGEDFTNGIKNGQWIYRDQNDRIISIVHYINDTLSGYSEYYEYLNDPKATKMSGLTLYGKKTGIWIFSELSNRKKTFKRWKKIAYWTYDLNGGIISRTMISKKGKIQFEAFYNTAGNECFWRFYDKKGKLERETNIYPYVSVLL